MEYGYSLIRINGYTNLYNSRSNFSEEVFLHEFLHTLERNNIEYGFETPALHNNEKYGYEEDTNWYRDYMQKKILDKSTNSYVGLDSSVYLTKPLHNENFKYSLEIIFYTEPKNIFEKLMRVFDVLKIRTKSIRRI